MANPILRIKRGSSTPASLSSGELAIDLANLNLFVGKADGTPLAIGGSGTFATKAYADAAVSTANTALTAAIAAEEAARIAADDTLTDDLSNEISRATAAEGVVAANLATETSNRTSADTALDGKITTEKNRIDAILSASQADKDSFAEIVSLINSVDTENDTAFAGYVTSNNAALAQEVTDRTDADTALGERIDDVESDATALDSRATDLETKTQNITATANITTVTGVMQNGNGSNVVDFGNGSLTFSGSQEFGSAFVTNFFEVGGNALIGGTALIEGNATFNGNIVGDGSTEIQNCIIDGGVY
jgi:hypothetical protein